MRFTRVRGRAAAHIVRCFIEDAPANLAAKLSGVNRKTANAWYRELRGRVATVVPYLPEVPSRKHLLGYHARRIAKFNGLSKQTLRLHMLESRVRYQAQDGFPSIVLDLATDLLSK